MKRTFLLSSLLVISSSAFAADAAPKLVVDVHTVSAEGIGDSIGSITFTEEKGGLTVSPKLKGISAGEHGFHIHEHPNCGPKEKAGKMSAAEAAGGHYDPQATGKHLGPHGGGHEGDLPKLVAAEDGSVTTDVFVPGLTLADVENRSVMVHAGGDNYSDTPAPLGGGGARIACGVIPALKKS